MNSESCTASRRPIICLLATEESSPGTLFGLHEVFSVLEPGWIELTGETAFEAGFDVRIVSETGGSVVCTGGITVTPDASIEDIDRADAVIVSDLSLDPAADHRSRWREVTRWLRRIHDRGGMICSVCSGAILVANTGLLDGHSATTHWGFVDHMRRFYPDIRPEGERILVSAGPEQRLVTGGGLTSWQDLALYLIARFHGEAAAIKASKLFLFGDRSEGQLPYATMARPDRHNDAVIASSQTWVAENYATANPVSAMVDQSGLPARTFKRRFRKATGLTPVDYVQRLRVEEAKQMLEMTSDGIDSIARQVGYEDTTSFRRLFKRLAGVTPGRYRQRYRLVANTMRDAG